MIQYLFFSSTNDTEIVIPVFYVEGSFITSGLYHTSKKGRKKYILEFFSASPPDFWSVASCCLRLRTYVHPCTVFLCVYFDVMCVLFVALIRSTPVFLSVAVQLPKRTTTAKTKYEYVTVP